MIYDALSTARSYDSLGPRYAAAFAFLRQARGRFALGRTDIVPGEVWAIIARKEAMLAAAVNFEYHRQYADIHLCCEGTEELGWTELMQGHVESASFNTDRDFGILRGPPNRFLSLSGDRFAIFFPLEPHAPWIGTGTLTKVCIKILVESPS